MAIAGLDWEIKQLVLNYCNRRKIHRVALANLGTIESVAIWRAGTFPQALERWLQVTQTIAQHHRDHMLRCLRNSLSPM